MAYLEELKALVGREIVAVDELDPADLAWWGGACPTVLITLDDGTQIIPQMDPEGNGPGWLALLHPHNEEA